MSAMEIPDAAVQAATQQVRMLMMGTGGVTLDQVNRYAEPLAQSIIAAVAPALIADAEKCGAVKALHLAANESDAVGRPFSGHGLSGFARLIESGEVTLP